MMKTVQEIFNVVIDEGFYTNDPIHNVSSWYMCEALHRAYAAERITDAEKHKALKAVDAYLQDYVYLRTALDNNALLCGFKDRLAIYKDWDNRPQLTHNLKD